MSPGARWTLADVQALDARRRRGIRDVGAAPPRASKLKNQPTEVDGIRFDSKKESAHYLLLKMRLRIGEIEGLELQPVFPIFVDTPDRGRIYCGEFRADFRYWEHCGDTDVLRVVDVKSPVSKTEAYQLRKKLVEAIYNLTILEP